MQFNFEKVKKTQNKGGHHCAYSDDGWGFEPKHTEVCEATSCMFTNSIISAYSRVFTRGSTRGGHTA